MPALILLVAISLFGADLVPAPRIPSAQLKWEPDFVPGAHPVFAENRRAGFALEAGRFLLDTSFPFVFANGGRASFPAFRGPLSGLMRSYPGNPAQARFASLSVAQVYPGFDFQFFWTAQEELRWRIVCSGLCNWQQIVIEVPQAAAVTATADGLEIRRRGTPLQLKGGLRVLGVNRFGLEQPANGVAEVTLTRLAPLPALSPLTTVDAAGNFYLPVNSADAGGIAKFDATGAFLYATWLTGGPAANEAQLLNAPGQIYLAGPAQSAGALITPGALQSAPGSYFLARVAPATGLLLSSTYLGTPGRKPMTAALLPDGDVVLLDRSGRGGFPASANAWLPRCEDPCRQVWAGRLNPELTRLQYGTWFPAGVDQLAVHGDGSIYFAGARNAGRLLPGASQALFERSLSETLPGEVRAIQIAPDGSFWVRRFLQVIRLDGRDGRTLATVPGLAETLTVDTAGTLHALMAGGCGLRHERYSQAGNRLSRITLPAGLSHRLYPGDGTRPLLQLVNPSSGGWFVVDPERRRPPTIACVKQPSRIPSVTPDAIAPGMLVNLVGDGLENHSLPDLEINGFTVPILGINPFDLFREEFSLDVQIPFEVAPFAPATLKATIDGTALAPFPLPPVQPVEPVLFPTILNADGTLNGIRNPASPGSIVTLWATGLGNTAPAMATGGIATQTPQTLAATLTIPGLEILYAGSAPGLSSGVTQINARVLPGRGSIELNPEARLGGFTKKVFTRIALFTGEPAIIVIPR